MSIYMDAFLLGFFLSIMTGPVFFAQTELAIQKGFWPAFTLVFGVWMSDLVYITLVFVGLSFISGIPGFNLYLGIAGGIILILFGLSSIKSSTKQIEIQEEEDHSNYSYLLKGFAINIFNPFVFVFWIGIIGNISRDSFSVGKTFIYLAIILATVGSMDILKIYIADKIRKHLNNVHLRWLRIIAGSGLVVFGIMLIYRVIAETF